MLEVNSTSARVGAAAVHELGFKRADHQRQDIPERSAQRAVKSHWRREGVEFQVQLTHTPLFLLLSVNTGVRKGPVASVEKHYIITSFHFLRSFISSKTGRIYKTPKEKQ